MSWINYRAHGSIALADLLGQDNNPNYVTRIDYDASRTDFSDGESVYAYAVDAVFGEIFHGGLRLLWWRKDWSDIDTFERDRIERLLEAKRPQPNTWVEMEKAEESEDGLTSAAGAEVRP